MPGIKNWLKKASNDLKASQKLSDDIDTFDCSVFHTHQCAEKAFKAFIIFTQKAVPKTHDLGFLLVTCSDFDLEFSLLQEECKVLNSFAYDSRYPNDSFYVDEAVVTTAIVMAEKILYTIRRKLKLNKM